MPAGEVEDETSLLEDYDFEIPCDSMYHKNHTGNLPATWIVRGTCPRCGSVEDNLRCEPGMRVLMASKDVTDTGNCGKTSPGSDWALYPRPLGKR